MENIVYILYIEKIEHTEKSEHVIKRSKVHDIQEVLHTNRDTTQQQSKKCAEVLMEGCNVQLTTLFQTGWIRSLISFTFRHTQTGSSLLFDVIIVSSVSRAQLKDG